MEIEVKETYPQCDGPMKLRTGRGGSYFLGCTKDPKCKGTRELSEDLLDQVSKLAGVS